MRQGQVYYKNEFAGVISETDEGFLFQYKLEYLASAQAKPVSLTLPLQEKAFSSKVLFQFFDGLIPEGWLLTIALTHWKINPNDRFSMLLTLCKDNIGCVSIISTEIES
jgi:serine/threonine-protein kinase HipA